MIRMKRLAGGVALTALACAMSSAVYAQETTSAVRGVVTANGEAIDKAAITAVHTPSGTRASTASSAGGNFDLRGLRVGGPYTLTVTAPGYTPKVYKNVFLQVGQSYDLSVDVAEVEELIVTGSGARNNEQGPKTVLGQQDIQSVVTINRDPRDLAREGAQLIDRRRKAAQRIFSALRRRVQYAVQLRAGLHQAPGRRAVAQGA